MFEQFKKKKVSFDLNYDYLPITTWEADEEAIEQFNEIYLELFSSWRVLSRTPSNGIKKQGFVIPSYDITISGSSVELTICSNEGFFRLQLSFKKYVYDEDGGKITGSKAFQELCKVCRRHGLNLEKLRIRNGRRVKKEIEPTMIALENEAFADLTFEGAHHIDIHSAWPAALTRIYPEFLPPIQEIYLKKKVASKESYEYMMNKAILNCAIGYMQSLISYHHAAWAHLSKAAINENNRYMRELAQKLKDSGRVILAYNTDGIWYLGDIYHGENEGQELGQWENDHINCKIRFKSGGTYEFIENEVYYPVMRGRTNLDDWLPRDQWQWGDIYKAIPKIFYFVPGIGIILRETEEFLNYYEFERLI